MSGDRASIAELLRRLRGPEPLTASRLAAAVGDELAGAGDDERRPVLAGLAEGLSAPTGPLLWPDPLPDDDGGPELAHRAAVLSGRLLDALLGETSDEAALLRAVAYASALATPQGQRPLGAPGGGDLVRAHVYASLLAERQGGPLEEDEERFLAGWLWSRAGRPMSAGDAAALERLRRRRRSR